MTTQRRSEATEPPKSPPCSRRPGTDLILDLGVLLFRLAESLAHSPFCKNDTPKRATERKDSILEAEAGLKEFLYNSKSPALRKAFDYNNRGRNIDDFEMRLLCYVSYAQLLSQAGYAGLNPAVLASALGEDCPGLLLHARNACGRLCEKGILRYSNEGAWGGHLYLSDNLLLHLAGGKRSPLLTFHAGDFSSADPAFPPNSSPCSSPAMGSNNPSRGKGPGAKPQYTTKLPHELFASISRRVIGVDEAVRSVCGRISLHTLRAGLLRKGQDPGTPNECLLLLGPSGCGKTYLAETAGTAAGLPFGSVSATDITSEGYVGLSIDDALYPLVRATGGNTEAARYGVCFIDEWDKKATRGADQTGRLDVSGSAVQQGVLRIMEGCVTQVGGRKSVGHRPVNFNSRGTLFMFAGAFVGLDSLLARETGTGDSIGFGDPSGCKVFRSSTCYDALVDYGLVPEFLNRLTGIIRLPVPTHAQLVAIATAEAGVIASYNAVLSTLSTRLIVSETAVDLMADYALETRTFSRGIKNIVSQLMESVLFDDRRGAVQIDAKEVGSSIDRIEHGLAA